MRHGNDYTAMARVIMRAGHPVIWPDGLWIRCGSAPYLPGLGIGDVVSSPDGRMTVTADDIAVGYLTIGGYQGVHAGWLIHPVWIKRRNYRPGDAGTPSESVSHGGDDDVALVQWWDENIGREATTINNKFRKAIGADWSWFEASLEAVRLARGRMARILAEQAGKATQC